MTDRDLPLAGAVVVVTRPRDRSGSWVEALSGAGADVILLPIFRLEIAAGDRWTKFLSQLQTVQAQRASDSRAPWWALTSASVIPAISRALHAEPQLADGVRIAAVGKATAEAARDAGLAVELVGDGRGAESLAATLIAEDPQPTLLHITSDRGLPVLVDRVREAGGEASIAVAVEHCLEESSTPERIFRKPSATCLTFASPSAVEGLFARVDVAQRSALLALPAVAIGETTASSVTAAGWGRVFVADSPDPESLVNAVARAADNI